MTELHLPEDTIFMILLRSPVRSVLRFKCVCKDWCALIDSCVFKDDYLHLRRANSVVDQIVGLKLISYDSGICKRFLTRWYDDYEPLLAFALSSSSSSAYSASDVVEISSGKINWSNSTTIIDHINGIVCVKGGNIPAYLGKNRFDVTLVNPALREFRKIPGPELGEGEWYLNNTGFGYDDATNDYKLFVIVSKRRYADRIGLVYRLNTDSWRLLGNMSEFVFHDVDDDDYRVSDAGADGAEFSLCLNNDIGVFLHGSIHFIMRRSGGSAFRLLAFNLTSESFWEMSFPYGWSYDEETVVVSLLTIDESTLCVAAFVPAICGDVEDEHEQVLDIWVMKEYGDTESWTKLYSLTSLPRFHKPLTFWRKDKLFLETCDHRLICYDLVTGQAYVYDPIVVTYPNLTKGPRHYSVCGQPSGWVLELVTGHESLVSLKQV